MKGHLDPQQSIAGKFESKYNNRHCKRDSKYRPQTKYKPYCSCFNEQDESMSKLWTGRVDCDTVHMANYMYLADKYAEKRGNLVVTAIYYRTRNGKIHSW